MEFAVRVTADLSELQERTQEGTGELLKVL